MAKDLAVHINEKWIGAGSARIKILGSCHFDVESGEFLVLLGESGCGKSTLLRMILALDSDYVGSIESNGRKVDESTPNRGMVFQEPRLLPWMTALQNIEFAMSGEDAGEARTNRGLKMLSLVGLDGFENNFRANCQVVCPRGRHWLAPWLICPIYCFWMNHLQHWICIRASAYRMS